MIKHRCRIFLPVLPWLLAKFHPPTLVILFLHMCRVCKNLQIIHFCHPKLRRSNVIQNISTLTWKILSYQENEIFPFVFLRTENKYMCQNVKERKTIILSIFVWKQHEFNISILIPNLWQLICPSVINPILKGSPIMLTTLTTVQMIVHGHDQ